MQYAGLFGYLGSNATVKNLGMINSKISAITNNTAYSGGIVGLNEGTITNCYNSGVVIATTTSGDTYSGGIAGENWKTITNCYNTGEVTGLDSGGIAGYNFGTIQNCYNSGDVTGSSYSGGIAGYNSTNETITNCYNSGDVTGSSYSGGIAGYNSTNETITNCYNSGVVTGTDYSGGIAGYNEGTITNCYSKSNGNQKLIGNDTGAAGCKTFDENGKFSDGSGSLLDALNEWVDANMRNTNDYRYWMDPFIQDEKYPVFTDWYGEAKRLNKAYPNDSKYKLPDLNDKGVYEITNEYQLALIADMPNGKYIQSDNIDLSGYEWRPIGNSSNKFNGTFDSQEYTISNLSVNINSKSGNVYSGLFGHLGSNATVKNLKMINSEISTNSESSYAYSGGIAGLNEGTITNCYNSGDVTANSESSYAYSGGIAGLNEGTITNCYNSGDVTATANKYALSGGIAGSNGASGDNTGTITNCYNSGDVTANSNSKAYSGGIAGRNFGTIQNCYNSGVVIGTTHSGGIAGYNYGTITNCYNTGAVSVTANGYVYSGGIAGYNSTNGTITNCYNSGDVARSSNSGGIAGRNLETIENCYYLDTCVLKSTNNFGTELTSDAMKRLNLLGVDSNNNLNKGQVSKPWSPDIFNVNGGYPILADVPTQIDPSKSVNKPPQSAVHITLDNELAQAENYLKPFIGTNGNEVTATVNYLINPGKDITSHQWYTMNDKGVFIEVSETLSPETIQETYYVKVTIDGYSYTSLTRTVSDTFIVMFDNNGGSGVDSIMVSKDSKDKAITKPKDPTKTGYDFEGWYSDEKLTTLYDFDTSVTKNTTLYAKWEPIVYQIKYCDGGNELTDLTPTSYTVESDVLLPPASKTGYNFVGWFEKDSENEFEYVKGTTMGNITLYAKWEAKATVTVKLDDNIWDKFDGAVYLYQNGEEKYTLNGSDGVYSGDVDPEEYQIHVKMESTDTGDPIDTKVSIDLSNGNNSAKVKYWTVTFDYKDDETEYLKEIVLNNSSVTKPEDPTRIGYTFEGWYTSADKEWNFLLDEVKSDMTLYAKWKEIEYRVVYNANGSTSGTVPSDYTLKINDNINVDINDGNLAKSGYIFRGWNYTPSASSALPLKTPLAKDVIEKYISEDNILTLYAVWTPIPEPIYTLCLNSNDSTLQTKRYSGTYGTEVTLKSASDFGWNNECKFIEWNSKSDGSGVSYKEGDKFSLGSEVWNLYAIWSDSSYHTVSFDSNGGSNVPSQSIQDGYRASVPDAPTKQGYLFKHWSLNGTKYDFNQSVKEDITLKAEYEIISYKVTFYYNGEVYYSTQADYNTSLGDRMPSLPSDKDKWNTSENGKGNNFTADSLITSDISVYAVSENSISPILIIGGSAAAILAAIAAWLFMRSRYN